MSRLINSVTAINAGDLMNRERQEPEQQERSAQEQFLAAWKGQRRSPTQKRPQGTPKEEFLASWRGRRPLQGSGSNMWS